MSCTRTSACCACTAGFGNCDGNQANGCETALTSLTNCGACGTTCDFAKRDRVVRHRRLHSRAIARNGISALARSGEHLVASSYDGAVYLVDPVTLEVVNTLRSMTQRLQPSALLC